MGYSTSKHRKTNSQFADEAYSIAGTFLGVTFGWTSASIYRNYYEIRSNWHRVPSKWRIPSVTGIIGMSIILTRALSYILRRIAPKKTKLAFANLPLYLRARNQTRKNGKPQRRFRRLRTRTSGASLPVFYP